jgi:DNA-binding NarL/FixJ family response regulator
VLDIRMPPTHTDEGVTAARAIKSDRPDLGVLLLSQHVETGATADLLGRPGFGYLLKDRVLDVREFVDTCERVARGGSALDSKVVAALIAGREASPLAQLSERERQVLALMAEGLSNTAIAERLVLSGRTVEAHVGHLLTKLDIPDSQETNRRVLAVLAWLHDAP